MYFTNQSQQTEPNTSLQKSGEGVHQMLVPKLAKTIIFAL